MLDALGNLKRTHYAGALRAAHEGQSVVLMGWVARRRDLGQLIFIDLRDREGIAQIVFNPTLEGAVGAREAHAKAETLRSEFVVAIEGRVVRRGKANPEIATGEVEVVASALHILNTSATPPFVIEDEINASEETRLRYRYLDLRRAKPQANLALRHKVILEIRKAMDELGFYEVETPMLTRATPEGARDYLVPSRVHPGQFYALPQSPQIFKQILMIAGLDRYFQIARCFRDEDLRADRQPDFTQLDLEMSFPTQDDVFGVIEQVMQRAWKVIGVDVPAPFRRMFYKDAIRRYGSDKPDLRFGMELADVTQHFEAGREMLKFEGSVFALAVPGGAALSRKELDELTEKAKGFGARAMYTIKSTTEGFTSALMKTLGDDGVKKIADAAGAKTGDLVIAVAAQKQIKGTETAAFVAGQMRTHLAEKLNLISAAQPFAGAQGKWEFVWLTGFPLFEWSETENRWVPSQHPFTGIVEEDLEKLETAPWEVRSKGYDLVLNGVELGSGSVRIHRADVQARIFRAIGLSDEQAKQRFGFFLDALAYGTPPHGGIALGLDRVVMLLAGEKSLREVIAFPKTTAAQDLMADAPNAIDTMQEDELELMGAYSKLPPKFWELAALGDEFLKVLDRELFSRVLSHQSAFQSAMSLIVAKAADDSRAVLRLTKAGYGPQAAGICRSIVEGAINSQFIALDPEKRGDAFLKSIVDSQRSLARKASLHPMPDDVKVALEEVRAIEEKSGWPRSVSERAYAIEKPNYAYDVVFLLLSQHLHSDIASLANRLKEMPSGFRIMLGRGPEWVDGAVITMFEFMTQIAEISYRAFDLDPKSLKAIGRKFESLDYSEAHFL